MMKLKFINPYLSIKQFDDVELSDFSVLTGQNGSGKTHILKGINNGLLQIEGIGSEEVIYFDYTNFLISNNANQNTQQKQKQNFDSYQKIKDKIQQKINESGANLENLAQQYFFKEIFSKSTLFPVSENAIFKDIRTTLLLSAKLFQQKTKNFEHDFNIVKEKFLDLVREFPKYFEISRAKNKNILSLSEEDFKLPSFLESELTKEVTVWLKNEHKNDEQEHKKSKGKNNNFIKWENWNSINGKSPIKYINEILEEYDFNNYRLKINNPDINLENYQSYTSNIVLRDDKNSTEIGFNTLSSGEKVLMALALLIYQQDQNYNSVSKVLLLDEIDATLHPSMIKKLQHVIDKKFILEGGKKVILATHSATTVALAENIYIVNTGNERNKIEKVDNQKALSILTEGFATIGDGIKFLDNIGQKDLVIFSEGNNVEYIEKAIEFFLSSENKNKIHVEKNIQGETCQSKLKLYFDFISRIEPNRKFLFIWDCDVAKGNIHEKNNTYAFFFEKNSDNKKFTQGIENLFPESKFTNEFYSTKPKPDGGHHKSFKHHKTSFKDHMIRDGSKEDFEKFKPMCEKIKALLLKR